MASGAPVPELFGQFRSRLAGSGAVWPARSGLEGAGTGLGWGDGSAKRRAEGPRVVLINKKFHLVLNFHMWKF